MTQGRPYQSGVTTMKLYVNDHIVRCAPLAMDVYRPQESHTLKTYQTLSKTQLQQTIIT